MHIPSARCTLVADTEASEGIMGRKKMKTDDKVDIRLRMDGDLHQRIFDAAEQEGNSVAAFIRSAVVKELKRREKGNIE